MNYNKPIQVKAANPIVTPIIDEPEPPKFNIVDVYVEKQETDPPTWILILIDSNQQQYKYNLTFS
jgi:hypothetical protein